MNKQRPMPRNIPPYTIAWNAAAPGIMQKMIWAEPMWNDPSLPRQLSMMRYEPGARSPLQKQVRGDELVFVIEGVLSDESGDVIAGNVAYRPEGYISSSFSPGGATTLSFVVGSVETVTEKAGNGPPSQIINVNEMAWQPANGDRLYEKAIWHDPIGERRFGLWKFLPGYEAKLHEHVGDELVFHVEGSFVDESGLQRPGDVGFRPFGCHHSWVSENGGIGLAYIFGGHKYLADPT